MTFRRTWHLSALLLAFVFFASSAAAQDEPKQDKPKEEQKFDRKAEDRREKRAEELKIATRKVLDKAQEEYRLFFREPKTALEHWVAIQYEMTVGKFDVAAYFLDKLLRLPEKEADDELLQIEEAEGLRSFLRLKLVKSWSTNADLEALARKDVETLIDRILAGLERKLGDPERIGRFIAGLSSAVPEERAFSLYQLQRSKHRAAPVLAEALRNSQPREQAVIKTAILHLDPDIMPAMLELYRARDEKDVADVDFRLNLLWLAKARAERRVIPYLWHMMAYPKYPAIVRERAKEVLAYLLDLTPQDLPPAHVALTQLAEKYYQNNVRWPDTTQVADRQNPDKLITMPAYRKWFLTGDGTIDPKAVALRPDEARFDFGLRYARQAIELDPSYVPAQAIYLAFLLEAEMTRKPYEGALDKILTEKRPAALQRLLAKLDPELVTAALDRAADEQNYSVLLPLIDALGDRADLRLAQPTGSGVPGPLVKMLYYPDRRVQYAAARAMLKLPESTAPVASTRIVDILGRFIATDAVPRVLIIARQERPAALRAAAKEAGFEADVVADAKDALTMLHRTADYDAIILDDFLSPQDLPFALTQLRADPDAAGLPLLLVAPTGKQDEIKSIAQRRRNTFVLPDVWATKGPELKQQLDEAIRLSAAPLSVRRAPEDQQKWLQYEISRSKGQALTETERKLFASEALDWLAQMARGELTGFDLRPARDALLRALAREETASQALHILARFPTTDSQRRLADIILDAKKSALHVEAARELSRHIQKNGLTLSADQVNQLRALEQRGDVPPAVRAELAVLVGTLRTTAAINGTRLLQYAPDPEPAPKK
jgi:CheY-like chemotaxis protein